MNKKWRRAVFILLFCTGLTGVLIAPVNFSWAETDAPGEVKLIPVEGSIDPGTSSLVSRSLEEAEAREASAVVLKLDTPGGYLDAAESIRQSMDGYPDPIYALVEPKAVSAGAYLALACDEIYMTPGSRMGNAEPQLLGGGAVDEKLVSDWEGDMRSLAQRNQRDEEIASDMVRRNLTLTDGEAQEQSYSEGTVDSLEALLTELGLEDASLVRKNPTLADSLVGWVTSPVVATLLLTLGLGGLILEVLTSGFGLAGGISILSFALYFGGHILGDLAGYEVILLFVLGVVFMLVEALMPGFGVFGGGGLILTLVSIVLAASTTGAGLRMLGAAILLAGILLFFILRYLSRRGVLRRFILEEAENKEKGYVAPRQQEELMGKEGETVTPLRPSGTAIFEGKRVDVVSEGDFIDRGARVKVQYLEGSRVVVREIDKE